MTYEEWIFEIHNTIPSTSDRCFDYISSGAEGVLAVVAYSQTAGRGTHQRKWHTPSGNLAFSFTLKSNFPSENLNFSFSEFQSFIQAAPYLIGISVYEVLKRILLPEAASFLSLKWPNDLLWKGRKISGILIESVFEGEVANIIVGIGLNIAQSPNIPGRLLTSIKETGSPVIRPEELAKEILIESKKWFSCWKIGRFPAIRREWLLRTCPKGTILEVGAGETAIKGRFVGITDLGHLMIEDQNGKMKCLVTTEMR
ncbi:biotin--[acetyl-CoA-carboxylase] ligase [Acetobacteraceae bacterium]|nr:biotin--[acetyl-CoA-carboxylase] ligase [Acetobacteraceae bacterium]